MLLACALAIAAGLTEPPSALRPVEAGVGDVGPLDVGLRQLRTDLRVPSGFDRVFRTAPDAGGRSSLVRFDSGIAAVFDRSQYRVTRRGPVAQIPAGTVFYIGGLPAHLAAPVSQAAPGPLAASFRAPSSARADAATSQPDRPEDTRADRRVTPPEEPAEKVAAKPEGAPSLWTDRTHRERVLERLVRERPQRFND